MHKDLEPIFHMYEDLVPILQMCDKIVPILHMCKNWVPILHTREKAAQRAIIAHLRAIINLWGLLRYSRATNATISCPILLKTELIQNILYVLISNVHASLKVSDQ